MRNISERSSTIQTRYRSRRPILSTRFSSRSLRTVLVKNRFRRRTITKFGNLERNCFSLIANDNTPTANLSFNDTIDKFSERKATERL